MLLGWLLVGAVLLPGCLGVPLKHPRKAGRSSGHALKSGQARDDIFSQILSSNEGSRQVILQGDVAVRRGRNALSCPDRACLWLKSSSGLVNVPYMVADTFNSSERAQLHSAMGEFTVLTCIQFINRTTERDYLHIQSRDGCWSYVGRVGGPQLVSLLKSSCLHHGVIQHELVHALGFQHEQCRSDRDKYIRVNWRNIDQDKERNFYKHKTRNLGVPYDYSSVMHYGKYAFASDTGKPTLEPISNPRVLIGQRFGLSALDIVKLNKLYQCNLCSFLLPEPQGSISSPSLRPDISQCAWLIRTQEHQVLLEFEYVDIAPTPGCAGGFLRVYDGQSRRSPLLLFGACGQKQLPALVGSSNSLLVEWVTRSPGVPSSFKAHYSSVACGGSLVAAGGNFSSPRYPMKYPNDMNCVWIISAPPGQKVFLHIGPLHLEPSQRCVYDFVSVRDEPRMASVHEGRLCGKAPTQSFTSSASSLRVHFHSDESVQAEGFLASYSLIPST